MLKIIQTYIKSPTVSNIEHKRTFFSKKITVLYFVFYIVIKYLKNKQITTKKTKKQGLK